MHKIMMTSEKHVAQDNDDIRETCAPDNDDIRETCAHRKKAV